MPVRASASPAAANDAPIIDARIALSSLHRLVTFENFRPDTLEKRGLTEAALKEINPGLIVSRISGFGQTGPYSKRPGFGAIGESMGGIRHLTGYPHKAPTRVSISLGDAVAALYSVIGIMTLSTSMPRRYGRE